MKSERHTTIIQTTFMAMIITRETCLSSTLKILIARCFSFKSLEFLNIQPAGSFGNFFVSFFASKLISFLNGLSHNLPLTFVMVIKRDVGRVKKLK